MGCCPNAQDAVIAKMQRRRAESKQEREQRPQCWRFLVMTKKKKVAGAGGLQKEAFARSRGGIECCEVRDRALRKDGKVESLFCFAKRER